MPSPIKLAYGRGFLDLFLKKSLFDITLVLPQYSPPLAQPEETFYQKAKTPMDSTPLNALTSGKSSSVSVVIVVSDHTRPVPNRQLIPWIVNELGVDDACISILVGTGTHQGPTRDELLSTLGPQNLDRFKVFIHDCHDSTNMTHVGSSPCGGVCLLNRHYVDADVKIATGFIEPHFFAGYSGGAKAIVPGIAGLDTISYFHRARLIADPFATWGRTDDNPVLRLSREMTSLCPPDCIVNVTMNRKKEITGLFIGNYISAHDAGCQEAAKHHCIPVHRKFPVVVTTNSGYPLDLNFYQTVKGISAAAALVEEGGAIIAVSECANGVPGGSEFETILSQKVATDDLLKQIMNENTVRQDQWQVQVLLHLLQKYTIYLYSTLDPDAALRCRVTPIQDIEQTLVDVRRSFGSGHLLVAVMPYGPLSIPVSTFFS